MNPYLAQVITASQPDDNSVRTGQVVSLDGTTLGVLINGGVVNCGYLATWIPTVGQTVAMMRQGADWLVLGPVGGPASQPDFKPATGVVQAAYWTGGVTASSTGLENVMGSWTSGGGFTFETGMAYRWDLSFGFYTGSTTSNLVDMRLRKGFTTAGQQLALWRRVVIAPAGVAGQVQMHSAHGFIKNTIGADRSAILAVSITRTNGANDVGIYGDANYRTILTLERIGSVADNETLANAAVSIT